MLEWSEAFDNYLGRAIGACTIPLLYVTCEMVTVPAAIPNLVAHRPYAAKYGLVEAELVARATHDHPLYQDDKASIYYLLEEATRFTLYAASIKPFQRTKDGHGAYLAIRAQGASRDKWETKIKRQDNLLAAYLCMERARQLFVGTIICCTALQCICVYDAVCAAVAYQLPNQHT